MDDKPFANCVARFQEVQDRVAAAACDAGRSADEVTIVAVTKTHGPETFLPLLEHGHRTFGENRVQEALDKWPDLRSRFPRARVHLIGPLQTNKVKDAVGFFDAIHSLDRPKLAAKIAQELRAQDKSPDLFVQVNTGEEPQKAGIAPRDLDFFLAQCREDFGLKLTGLMCIPPVAEEAAPHFALLAKLARRNGLEHLSMGMTQDFEKAVAYGATHIRVGSALFGPRPSPGNAGTA